MCRSRGPWRYFFLSSALALAALAGAALAASPAAASPVAAAAAPVPRDESTLRLAVFSGTLPREVTGALSLSTFAEAAAERTVVLLHALHSSEHDEVSAQLIRAYPRGDSVRRGGDDTREWPGGT